MSLVQIVTLVAVGLFALGCLVFFLMDLWNIKKSIDQTAAAESTPRKSPLPDESRLRGQRTIYNLKENDRGKTKTKHKPRKGLKVIK